MRPRLAHIPLNAVLLTFIIVAAAACTSSAPPATAAQLAERLQQHGLAVESISNLPQPKSGRFRFDEAIALDGADLRVEILRIEDERVYKIALDAGAIIALAEHEIGSRFPGRPDIYSSKPFIIVVRQEPEPGFVQQRLREVLVLETS